MRHFLPFTIARIFPLPTFRWTLTRAHSRLSSTILPTNTSSERRNFSRESDPASHLYGTNSPALSSTSLTKKRQSTVSLGTSFEIYSLHTLNAHFSMDLKRVGGKDDGGVDLVGWWWVPARASGDSTHIHHEGSKGQGQATKSNRRRIRVIAQCKAEKKKMGPNRVRELEGVAYRLASEHGQRLGLEGVLADEAQTPIVALLISSSPFTKAALLQAHSSPLPMFLLHLPFNCSTRTIDAVAEEEDVTCSTTVDGASAIWNQALSGSGGVLGGELEVRWERRVHVPPPRSSPRSSMANGSSLSIPVLWWKGHGPLGSLVPRLGPTADMLV